MLKQLQKSEVPQPKASGKGLVWRVLPWLMAAGVLYWTYFRKVPDAKPEPDRNATATEKDQAAKAVPAKQDRAIVAGAFDALAELLEEDGKDKQPAIKTREQVSEQLMAETARSLTIVGIEIVDKETFALLASSFFDSDAEFPTKAGPLSEGERVKGVAQIKAFANAFK
jgi:hypothetical protein